MVTLFFITKPRPIFAPKARSKIIFMLINGFQEARTNKALIKYHVIIFSSPAPLSKLPVENAPKFTLSILLSLFL